MLTDGVHRALKLIACLGRNGTLRVRVDSAIASERALLATLVEKGDLHIIDCGIASIDMFKALAESGADFVARISRSWKVQTVEHNNELTDADRGAGVVSDQILRVTKEGVLVLLVCLYDTQGREYRIATSLRSMSALQITNLYRERWRVELRFRLCKAHIGARLSLHHEGACQARLIALCLLILILHLLDDVGVAATIHGVRAVEAAIEHLVLSGHSTASGQHPGPPVLDTS